MRVDSAIKAIKADLPNVRVEGIVADFASASGAEAVTSTLTSVDILVNNVNGCSWGKRLSLVRIIADTVIRNRLPLKQRSKINCENVLPSSPSVIVVIGELFVADRADITLLSESYGSEASASRPVSVNNGMKRRRESNSWTTRWQRLAALMDYGDGAEVQRRSEERDGPCQPPPGGKLPRRNVRAGQNGRLPSGRNRRVYRGTLLNAMLETVAEKPAFAFGRADESSPSIDFA
jgi:hypothetical protein